VETDRIIASLASEQHSVVTRPQLLAAGVSPRAIELRLTAGGLVAMHAGVYRPAGHPRSWTQSLMAAALAGGPSAVVSHRGAAYLLGMPGIEPRAEISVAPPRTPRLRSVLVHRAATLGPPDVSACEGIACTRPARTVIDLAGILAPPVLEVALDDLLSRRLITVDYMRRRLDALGRQGRRGAGTLFDLLADRADGRPRTTSEFERRLLATLRRAGVPLPRTQFEVALPGGRVVVLDYAYPDELVALEADSYRHHSSRTDWGRDRVRNRLLTAIGWRILPVTWDDLADPDPMLDAVRRGLRGKPRCAG
jgi:very-short-patch-repair endonuclease